MDTFDLTKPLCIFILDLGEGVLDEGSVASPEDIVQEYVDSVVPGTAGGSGLVDQATDESIPDEACDAFPVPCPAIRGSTLPFGGWGRPKRSLKISSGEI